MTAAPATVRDLSAPFARFDGIDFLSSEVQRILQRTRDDWAQCQQSCKGIQSSRMDVFHNSTKGD